MFAAVVVPEETNSRVPSVEGGFRNKGVKNGAACGIDVNTPVLIRLVGVRLEVAINPRDEIRLRLLRLVKGHREICHDVDADVGQHEGAHGDASGFAAFQLLDQSSDGCPRGLSGSISWTRHSHYLKTRRAGMQKALSSDKS